jgi:predicted HicB family RNase H-like nuclease
MGAIYTKAQAKASAEYLKKLDEIRIRIPKGKKEQYKQMAEAEGKSLNQFIIDKIEGGSKS